MTTFHATSDTTQDDFVEITLRGEEFEDGYQDYYITVEEAEKLIQELVASVIEIRQAQAQEEEEL